MGLAPCATPVQSPESNGMAEGFVETFKRDYVHVNRLDNAGVVLEQMPGWIKDYNEGDLLAQFSGTVPENPISTGNTADVTSW
jgi:hypothetical protein